jgi:membrane protease YdiL (CAAX protease family)
MGVAPSLIAFGIPAFLVWILVWVVMPSLRQREVAEPVLFAVLALPFVWMLFATVATYRREGRRWSWRAFRDRVRLGPLDRRTAAFSLALTLAGPVLYLGAARAVDALLPDASFPPVLAQVLGDEGTFLGTPMKGAYWLVGAWLAFYLLNVFGEELWFRGIVLPRQEVAFGRRAWVVHSGLWAAFHGALFPADALVILPEAVAYGWVAQRSASLWPGVFAHAALNALAAIRIVKGVLA